MQTKSGQTVTFTHTLINTIDTSHHPYLVVGSASYTVATDTRGAAINLGGTTKDSSGNDNILVGQQCTASLDIAGFAANSTAVYNWNVSGTTFISWTPTYGSNLMASNHVGGFGKPTDEPLHFYWDDTIPSGGTQTETLTCTATVTPPAGQGDPITATATKQVNVEVSTVATVSNTFGVAQLNNLNPSSTYGATYALFLGPNGSGRGITWNGKVTTPSLFTGQGTGTWYYLQLVKSTSRTHNVQNGPSIPDPNNGKSGLDNVTPYHHLRFPADNAIHADGDSPGTGLDDAFYHYKLDESFQTYLMYTPPSASGSGTDVMDVPVWEIDWFWGGEATRIGTSWANNNNVSPNPQGSVTSNKGQSTHPEWTDIVTNQH